MKMIDKVTVHFPDGKDEVYHQVTETNIIYKLDYIWAWKYLYIYNVRTVETSEDKSEVWVEFVD